MRESWINTIVSQLYAGGNLGSPKHDEARGSPTKTSSTWPLAGRHLDARWALGEPGRCVSLTELLLTQDCCTRSHADGSAANTCSRTMMLSTRRRAHARRKRKQKFHPSSNPATQLEVQLGIRHPPVLPGLCTMNFADGGLVATVLSAASSPCLALLLKTPTVCPVSQGGSWEKRC